MYSYSHSIVFTSGSDLVPRCTQNMNRSTGDCSYEYSNSKMENSSCGILDDQWIVQCIDIEVGALSRNAYIFQSVLVTRYNELSVLKNNDNLLDQG